MIRRIFVFFSFWLVSTAHALSGVTVQGRLLRSDSSPVTSPQLQFKIQIRSPGNENCLLYEETQIKDLSSSDGNFSFIVQDSLESSRVRTDTTGLSLEKIFANRVAFTGLSCGSGTSYTPSATDARVLQVLFREDVSAAWEPMPSQRVSAVPVALQALQIEGYTSSQLLRVADGSTLTELSAGDATNLSTLIAGTSASFVKPADLPACNTNEYLTKSGSTVSCAPVSGSAGGTVTSVATGTGLTGGPIVSTGTISLANIASNTLLGNSTGGAAAPSAISLTSMIDASMGSAQGSVLYRDASGWTVLAPGTSGYFLKTQGASANPVWASASTGSVSSVDLSAPSIFAVSGNPITSSGTIALSLASQNANTVFAGPASGGAAAPSFRALNIPDLRSSVAGAFLTGSGCTAGQGLVYSSVNDNISCQDIAVTSSQVTTGLGYTPVDKAGDTMSGALNLPTNGLIVGTNQLVVAGGKVGIGSAGPVSALDVVGSVSASTGFIGSSWTSASGAAMTMNPSALGTAIGTGGAVTITGGAGGTTAGGGGSLTLSGGAAGGGSSAGGSVTLKATNSAAGGGAGGSVTISSGQGTTSAGGNITLTADRGAGTGGGVISLQSGNGFGSNIPGGAINMTAGASSGASAVGGDITVTSGVASAGGRSGNLVLAVGAASGGSVAGTIQLKGGSVGIGTTSPAVLLNVAGSNTWSSEVRLENQSSTSAITPSFSAYNWASTFGGYPTVGLFNSRGSKASASAVLSGDTLGTFAAYGYDGSGNGFGGAVSLVAAEDYSATAHGAYMAFSTVGLGTTTASERMVIREDGRVGIGTDSPAATLHVNGHIGASGATPTASGCGTGASVSGNDTRGIVSVGSSSVSSCQVNFSTAYGSTPVCVLTVQNSAALTFAMAVNPSTTNFVINFSTSVAAVNIAYLCMQ